MHRNEGANMNNEGGILRFIDQNLPGTPGSTVLAEWGNAVTEEILGILAEAGISPNATAALDRAEGWVQMRDAIFRSAALTAQALATGSVATAKLADLAVTQAKIAVAAVSDEKISDVDLAKAFGALTLAWSTPGASGYTKLDENMVELRESGGGSSWTATLEPDGLAMEASPAGSTTKNTVFSGYGMQNTNVAGSSALRLTVWDCDDLGKWTDGGQRFADTIVGLPKGTRIVNAYFSYQDEINVGGSPDGGISTYDGPATMFSNTQQTGALLDNFRYIKFDSLSSSTHKLVQINLDFDVTLARYTGRRLHIVHS